jgi:hypothetical protein
MDWLALVVAGLALMVAALLFLRWLRQRDAADSEPASLPGDEAKRLHAQTALSELRHMREALAPAAHNRVERRRSPPPGTGPKIERRRKGVRRSP